MLAAVTCCCFSFGILTTPDSVSAYERSVLVAPWYIKYLHYQQSSVSRNRVFLEDSFWRVQEVYVILHLQPLRFLPKYLLWRCFTSLIARNSNVVCVPQATALKIAWSQKWCWDICLHVSQERVVQIIKSMVDLQNAVNVKAKIQLLAPMFYLLLLRIKSLLFIRFYFYLD